MRPLMRIVQTSPHSLTARHWPFVYWLLAGALLLLTLRALLTAETVRPDEAVLSALFALMAMALLFFWGSVVTLTIDRRRRVVEVQRHGLFGAKTVFLHPLEAVADVYVEDTVSRGKAGRVTHYRLVVMSYSGEAVPLTPYSPLDFGMARTAEALRTYLKELR